MAHGSSEELPAYIIVMTKIVLAGADGRMGRAILKVLPDFKGLHLTGALESMGHPHIGKKIFGEVKLHNELMAIIRDADVLIDFTSPESSIVNLKIAASTGKPVVIGATGHNTDQRAEIASLSKMVPIVHSPNMSVGVNVMWKIITEAAQVLGADYKIDIVEAHHVHKKDAPSGTAKKMVEMIEVACGEKVAKQVNVKSIREGEIVGDHEITFASPYETLSISHHAVSREVFAAGALKAAAWLVSQPAGLYNMNDVLGI